MSQYQSKPYTITKAFIDFCKFCIALFFMTLFMAWFVPFVLDQAEKENQWRQEIIQKHYGDLIYGTEENK